MCQFFLTLCINVLVCIFFMWFLCAFMSCILMCRRLYGWDWCCVLMCFLPCLMLCLLPCLLMWCVAMITWFENFLPIIYLRSLLSISLLLLSDFNCFVIDLPCFSWFYKFLKCPGFIQFVKLFHQCLNPLTLGNWCYRLAEITILCPLALPFVQIGLSWTRS